MGKIHFYAREKWGVYSVQKGAITFIVSQDFLLIFIILRRGTGNIAGKEIKKILAVRIKGPYFMGIFRLYRRETQRKLELTVHHKGSPNNIYFLF